MGPSARNCSALCINRDSKNDCVARVGRSVRHFTEVTFMYMHIYIYIYIHPILAQAFRILEMFVCLVMERL